MNCIFCKIINGEIPCFKIYENDYVLAFLDIDPDSDGHTLIIPKKHIKDFDDIDDLTLNEINKSIRIVKRLLEDKLHFNGLIIQQNNGSVQEVKHYHVHLKPCYDNKVSIDMLKHKEFIDDPKNIYEILKKEN